MITYRRFLLVLFACLFFSDMFAQGLENLPAVQLNGGAKVTSSYLMISLGDFQKFFTSESSRYSDCIEIVDDAQPWPPVWFSAAPPFKIEKPSKKPELNIITNFTYQNGTFAFYKEHSILKADSAHIVQHKIDFTKKKMLASGYVLCNSGLKAVDTLKSRQLPLNLHCIAINAQKEKLVMLQLDTMFNIKPAKGLVKALVDIIAIYDSTNALIFEWNPVKVLGLDAVNPKYAHAPSTSVGADIADWSHGNSLSWDFDGNILYSFRHIGVGKISRLDGHVIWRLDSKKVDTDNPKDSMACYLQHDIEPVKSEGGYTFYSLFSDGDGDHPKSFGLLFKVNSTTGAAKFVSRRYSASNIASTGAGNYDVDARGNYILSYGIAPDNSNAATHTFCEMGQSDGHIVATYSLPKNVFAFKVLKLKRPAPARPTISRKNNALTAHGYNRNWVWYQLTGVNNSVVTKAGTGAEFKPSTNGTYCVAGKLGAGYAVSEVFVFKQ